MHLPNRRTFALASAGAVVATAARPVLGANDRINVALVGAASRGRDHINEWGKQPNSRIVVVCDVNQENAERSQALVAKVHGAQPQVAGDMRKVFESKDIDAVSFATPNHWHALGTIWACQAGKDVYVEKPACHTFWEGRKMVEAARKYKRVVQVGSQSRSLGHVRKAVELLGQGVIGKVYMAKGICFNPRQSIGHTPDTPVPAGINWDIFLGPAPMRPFTMNRYKYNWHWFWDTGNGDIGNQGIHEMDIARWGLGVGLPQAVVSTGGRFVWDDDGETPNTQLATLDYPGCQIVFDVRNVLTPFEGDVRRGNHSVGNVFLGSEGYMTLDGSGFRVYKGAKNELALEQKHMEERIGDCFPHFANFVTAMRSRNYRDLRADVEIGVASAALFQLANISYRTGRRLKFDPAAGRFTGDAEANRMLRRRDRAPYVVPEAV